MRAAGRTVHIAAAVLLIAASFVLHRTRGYETVTIAVMLISTVNAGLPIFKKAAAALRYRIVGIDALVTTAVIGAVIIGEYWEAAAVTFLFLIGDYLEGRTLEKTRSSIRTLMDLAPDTARVRTAGGEAIRAPGELVPGDVLILKPGEKIPADGTVIEGTAHVDQAAVTGESIPVGREVGDRVFSGTVLTSGYLLVNADQVGEETTFARILHLVEEAQDSKAATQKFLERFSRWYTPAVMLLSAGLYAVTGDIRAALTLLVIACPGALVISVPVSVVAGIGSSARRGILVKGGEIMEQLGRVKAVAFDKTGTLTIGKPAVAAVHPLGIDEDELLSLAAAGEAYSEHPLAAAVIDYARERGVDISRRPEETEFVQGRGVRFSLEGKQWALGNRALFSGLDLSSVEPLLEQEERQGRTAVLAGNAEQVVGILSVADTPRAEASQVVAGLRGLGIEHLVILSGDNERTVRAVAEELGIDAFRAELLPEEKLKAIARLQERYGTVAMVGDGINDAPALAAADVGIAVGAAGNDAAMESADVVLLGDGITRLAEAMGRSRATVRNMKENIFFAVAVAALLLSGVLFGSVTLSVGMLVHELSVLLVIINAVRLLGRRSGKRWLKT